MNNGIFVSLGSNLGERKDNLAKAKSLMKEAGLGISQQSSIYETEPWGDKKQPSYLNQVVQIATTLEPEKLMGVLLDIEQKMGRTRSTESRYQARTIDLDLLFYHQRILKTGTLTLPHPALHERNFVLVPMMEIASMFNHPSLNLPIEELYLECRDETDVVQCD